MEKELEIKLRSNFEETLNRFDFAKVHDVMEHLDWTWWDSKHTPTQERMIAAVTELFNNTMSRNYEEFTNAYCYSGGFCVTIYNDGKVRIQFIVEDIESFD